jgi:hypothetical protein
MPKQRQVRIEQGLSPALMEEMQERTEEQLEAETKHRSIALSILGSRAAERYDAEATRTYFRRALAASRPQERPQIRRMANASLALAEHRAGDLKVAVEKLGQEAPPKRALMGLRLMGLIAPPKGAPTIRRVRGIAIVALIVLVLLLLGLGVVELISLPFGGGLGLPQGILLGILLIIAVLSGLAVWGRRRQKTAQAKAKTARARPGAAQAAAPPASRRFRGIRAKAATGASKSSTSAAPGGSGEGRARGSQPAKAAQGAAKPSAQARSKSGVRAPSKPAAQARTKPAAPARTKPAAQARTKPAAQARTKPAAQGRGAAQGAAKPAAEKPAAQARTKSGGGQASPKPAAAGSKPGGGQAGKPGGGQAGGKPRGQGSKPTRRTRGSGPAK